MISIIGNDTKMLNQYETHHGQRDRIDIDIDIDIDYC